MREDNIGNIFVERVVNSSYPTAQLGMFTGLTPKSYKGNRSKCSFGSSEFIKIQIFYNSFYVGPKMLLDSNNLPLDSKDCLTNYRLIGQLDIPGSQKLILPPLFQNMDLVGDLWVGMI